MPSKLTYNDKKTMEQISQGKGLHKRSSIVDAFKGAGATVKRSHSDSSELKIKCENGQNWTITVPLEIKLHNAYGALQAAAKAVLSEYEKTINAPAQASSTSIETHDL